MKPKVQEESQKLHIEKALENGNLNIGSELNKVGSDGHDDS